MSGAEKRLKSCCFTGHRPEKLGRDEAEAVRLLDAAISDAYAAGYRSFISGMARSVDIWAAELVLKERRTHPDIHLIDACKDKCYELTARESEAVSEQEMIKIRWMLTRIDGLKAARQMEPDVLAEWVLDLRENGTIFSRDDLRKVSGAMMKME